MLLTGKSKRTFLKWLKIRVNSKLHEIYKIEFWFNLQDESFKITLIVEWFDSVGICIDRDCINMEMVITDFRDVKEKQTIIDCGLEEPFPDWWKKAIKKANEIYNEKYSISQ